MIPNNQRIQMATTLLESAREWYDGYCWCPPGHWEQDNYENDHVAECYAYHALLGLPLSGTCLNFGTGEAAGKTIVQRLVELLEIAAGWGSGLATASWFPEFFALCEKLGIEVRGLDGCYYWECHLCGHMHDRLERDGACRKEDCGCEFRGWVGQAVVPRAAAG